MVRAVDLGIACAHARSVRWTRGDPTSFFVAAIALGGCEGARVPDAGVDAIVLEGGTDAPRPRVPEDDFVIASEVFEHRDCPAWAAPPRRVTEASEDEPDLAPRSTL